MTDAPIREETVSDSTDTDSSMIEVMAVTVHDVHTALLEQWRGLELRPEAFVASHELVYRFFNGGCSDALDQLDLRIGTLAARVWQISVALHRRVPQRWCTARLLTMSSCAHQH